MRLVDADELMAKLRISENCDSCPRYENGRCKGHLSWVCKRINETLHKDLAYNTNIINVTPTVEEYKVTPQWQYEKYEVTCKDETN